MFSYLNQTAISSVFRIIIALLVILSVLPVLSSSALSDTGDAKIVDGGTFFVGQTLWTEAYNPGDDVDLEDGGGTFISDVPVSSDDTLFINTASLAPGNYRLRSPSGPAYEFELVRQDYSVTATPVTVKSSGPNTLSELTISSNRAEFQNVLTSPDFNTRELDRLFPHVNGTVADLNGDGSADALRLASHSPSETLTANFSGVTPGTYTINFGVADSTAADNVTITVESTSRGSASFGVSSKVVEGQLGTVVDIPIHLRNSATATLVLGSSSLNYRVRIEVTDGNGDGILTVNWDTASAGQGSADDAFNAADGADSVSATRSTGRLPGTLATEAYPMNLSVDGRETDVGTVSLREASTPPVCGRAITPLVDEYNKNVGAIPEFASGIVKDETIHGIVNEDDTRNFTLVTGSDKRLNEFRAGAPDGTPVVVVTDCQTLTAIIDAEDPVDLFVQAYENGEVKVRGTGFFQSLIVEAIKVGVKIASTLGML